MQYFLTWRFKGCDKSWYQLNGWELIMKMLPLLYWNLYSVVCVNVIMQSEFLIWYIMTLLQVNINLQTSSMVEDSQKKTKLFSNFYLFSIVSISQLVSTSLVLHKNKAVNSLKKKYIFIESVQRIDTHFTLRVDSIQIRAYSCSPFERYMILSNILYSLW